MEYRYEQLNTSLTQRGMPVRQSDEAIAVFVPKRRIETWIHYLLRGGPVSEEEMYPRMRGRERDCYPAAERFSQLDGKPEMPEGCPPSLVRGVTELRRIPKH